MSVVEVNTILQVTVFLVQVVEDAPYCTQLDIMDKHGCEFCAHGGECAHVEGVCEFIPVEQEEHLNVAYRTQLCVCVCVCLHHV